MNGKWKRKISASMAAFLLAGSVLQPMMTCAEQIRDKEETHEPCSYVFQDENGTVFEAYDLETLEMISGYSFNEMIVQADSEETGDNTETEKLPAPAGLQWNIKRPGEMSWEGVPGSEGWYAIEINKDGELYYNTDWSGLKEIGLTTACACNDIADSGTYTFRVKALGSQETEADDSDWSDWSEEWTYEKPDGYLNTPTGMRWDKTVGLWNPVEISGGYETKLYRNGLECGSVSSHSPDFLSEDFGSDRLGYMREKGSYTFRVRTLSEDITKVYHSGWSGNSSAYITTEVAASAEDLLNQALEQAGQDPDGALQNLADGMDVTNMAVAMQTDMNVLSKVKELESIYAARKNITVTSQSDDYVSGYIDQTKVSVIGAALNAESETQKMVLDFSQPEEEIAEDGYPYRMKNWVQFSINLSGCEKSELTVPVCITIPIPKNVTPERFRILHYHQNGTYEELEPRINDDGTASFTVTSFSTFVFGNSLQNLLNVGNCGKSVMWEVFDGYQPPLYLSGTGETTGYQSADEVPWKDLADRIMSVRMSDGITGIGQNLFAGLSSLSYAVCGTDVQTIGESAFSGCQKLENVTFDKAVSSIGKNAFYNCTGLKNIYYKGTEVEWKRIEIAKEGNELLLAAELYCEGGSGLTEVTITPVTDPAKTTRTIEELPMDIDIRDLFILDPNCGVAVYSMLPGTGSGNIKEDGILTVTQPGTFKITVSTAAHDVYAAGEASIDLTVNFHEKEILPAPTADISSGSLVKPGTKVELSCVKENASIYYTTDGSVPTTDSNLYTAPIVIEKDMVLTAFAVLDGYKDSPAAVFNYTLLTDDYDGIWPEDMPEGEVISGIWTSAVKDQVYTGSAIKPDIRVYYGNKRLREGTDYTVSYKNNVKAGTKPASNAPAIIVTGKGAFSGKRTVTFTILPKNISDEDMAAADLFAEGTTKMQKPVPEIFYKNKKLKNKSEFTVSYPDTGSGAYTADGTYRIKLTGKGNFTGERNVTFSIGNVKSISKVKVSKISNQLYTGKEIKPQFTVTYGKTKLAENSEYTVTYEDNIEQGTAAAIIKGMGDYAGEKRVVFQIVGKPIKKAKISGWESSVLYNGEKILQDCTLSDGEKILIKDTDYHISYQNNKEAGTATVIFTGINMYSGTLKKTYKIQKYDILKDEEKKMVIGYVNEAGLSVIAVQFGDTMLTENEDYILTHKKSEVIVTGKGNFKGKKSIFYQIATPDISQMELSISDKVYQNKKGAWKAAPVVIDPAGKKLTAGTDYDTDVAYFYAEPVILADGTGKTGEPVGENDIPPLGTTIMIKIRGKGSYRGELSGKYRIVEKSIANATAKISQQYYTGSAVEPGKDAITLKMNGKALYDQDYEIVSYSNNRMVGTATITIKGTGKYGGIKTIKFKIKAKKVSNI